MKFCKYSRISPELLTILEIRKMLKVIRATSNISFTQFIVLLETIATAAFTEALSLSEKVKMLFMHMKNPCKLHY